MRLMKPRQWFSILIFPPPKEKTKLTELSLWGGSIFCKTGLCPLQQSIFNLDNTLSYFLKCDQLWHYKFQQGRWWRKNELKICFFFQSPKNSLVKASLCSRKIMFCSLQICMLDFNLTKCLSPHSRWPNKTEELYFKPLVSFCKPMFSKAILV